VRAKSLILLLLACSALPAAGQSRPTPSGLPVPRWVSLKFDRVNARAGPGDDHRLLWVYRVKTLPVQVVQETRDWRRVCDPDAGLAWVHKRTTDGRRTVMNLRIDRMPLIASPGEGGRTRAYWLQRSLGALEECQGSWCRIKVEGVTGWAPRSRVWGVQEAAVCASQRS